MADASLRALTSWPEIQAAAGHHPYVLCFGSLRDSPVGYALDGAVAWFAQRPAGRFALVHGAPEPARELVLALRERGELVPAAKLIVSREAFVGLPKLGVTQTEDWDFLWTTATPPPQPGEGRVEALTDADAAEIDAILDLALPESVARPGRPGVRRWYGIRDGDRLLACGADFTRGVAPCLAGIAVAPSARGHGLGTALTAAMTRRLLPEHGTVGLGVYTDNHPARHLYGRLGYTNHTPKTTATRPDLGWFRSS